MHSLWRYRFHLLIFILSFCLLSRFVIDPDLGWHLALGEKFLKTGEVMQGDSFSWTMNGYVFANAYFFYQVMVAALFKLIGYPGMVFIFGAIASLAILIILPRRLNIWQVLLCMLGVSLGVSTLGVRPSTISLFFFCTLLALLGKENFYKGRFAVFWLIFFFLWANFHQGFLAGFLVFAIFMAAKVFSQKRRKTNYITLGLLLVSAVIGFCLIIFNLAVFKTIFWDLTGYSTWLVISEWQSIVSFLPLSLVYLLSGLVFIYLLFRNFKNLKVEWIFLYSVTFMLPFLAVVFTPFWAAAFIHFSLRYVKFKLVLDKLVFLMLNVIIAAVFLALALNFAGEIIESWDFNNRLKIDKYPVAAVEYMKANGLTGGVFNSYPWGGYIDFAAPEIKVFIDGRMTGWRDQRGGYILDDYISILQGKCDVASSYAIGVVLLQKDTKTKCFEGFDGVYQDDVAKVLVKRL